VFDSSWPGILVSTSVYLKVVSFTDILMAFAVLFEEVVELEDLCTECCRVHSILANFLSRCGDVRGMHCAV
jgi:hypothetical protein